MKPSTPVKPVIPLLVLCLFLSVLPIAPGQNFHGFIVPALFYHCVTQQRSMGLLFALVLVLAVVEYGALNLYYAGNDEIAGDLKRILMWEKPFFILLLAFAIFILLDKMTVSIGIMIVILTVTMLIHTAMTSVMLKVQGGYRYVDFVFAEFNVAEFHRMLLDRVVRGGGEEVQARTIINWTFSQLPMINMVSNLLYTLLLSRLFYKRLVGLRNEIFLSFRLPGVVNVVFLISWGVSLVLFFTSQSVTPPTVVTVSHVVEHGSGLGGGLLMRHVLFGGVISVLLVLMVLYSLQGLSCLAFYVKAFGLVRTRRRMINVLILASLVVVAVIISAGYVVMLLFGVLFLLGVLDQWRNFRGIVIKRVIR
ncbi:hypothetical protein COTS27_01219 [Spirochaetota bacterium]|nr:hypothetical protein COTS27_01219 [Spirochaetota bacterium]